MNLLKTFFKETVEIDKRKGIAGLVLAVFAMIICGIFGAWARCIAYGVLFSSAGYIRVNVRKNRSKWLFFAIWLMAVSTVTWAVPSAMVSAVLRMDFTYTGFILNIFCIFAVCGVVCIITAKPKLSVIIGTFLLIVIAMVNGVIYQFRGKEMGFGDILSVKTAISVAGRYNFTFSPQMAHGWLFWLFSAFAGFSIPKLPVIPKIRGRLIMLVTECAIIFLLWVGSFRTAIKTWDNEGTRLNGYYLNFYLGMRDSGVEKPKNYSPVSIAKLAQEYQQTENVSDVAEKPNIIVIIDESYADFRIFGDLRTNRPVTPFLDSLEENTVRGYTLASVYGGNTANTEFEFLTGGSMAFLPKDSVPYQQFIRGNTYTLARFLNACGYNSEATHPYWKSGWSRDLIYPYFGFKEITFIDSYDVEKPMRDYVSDRDMFEHVLDMLENKKEDNPLFLFGITMQNHGGYDYSGEDFEPKIELEGYSEEYPLTQQYLSLIHETDSAMEYLLNKLQNYSEKTVVLFFGDHFPGVEQEFYEEIYGKEFETLEDKMLRHKVPFIIWANYDISEKTVDITSINYLSNHLFEAAGIPTPTHSRFLADVEKAVPAMNALGYWSNTLGKFEYYNNAVGEEAEWLEKYKAVMYNQLFDKKKKSEIFFGY